VEKKKDARDKLRVPLRHVAIVLFLKFFFFPQRSFLTDASASDETKDH
jgi:hypothetical protein